MPSFLQLQALTYTDVAETLFYGGTTRTPVSDTEFRTTLGNITVRFLGRDLTYNRDGSLAGGTVEEYRVYQGAIDSSNQLIIGTSAFTLLTVAEINLAFALAAAGRTAEAVQGVTTSWTSEYFSQSNFVGGTLKGYDGDDGLFASYQVDTVYGGGGNDYMDLGYGDDTGYGGVGNDRIDGSDGNDLIFAETGNDIIYSGSGNDLSFGGGGDDIMSGGRGHDRLYGGAGVDTIVGETGNDTIFGAQGDDKLYGQAGEDSVLGDTGNDQILGGAGNDLLYGGVGADSIAAEAGNDQLFGGKGRDILTGGRGDDLIAGGAGNDLITGGPGNDTLAGGAGFDWFVFQADAGTADLITDFTDDGDLIDLIRLHLTSLTGLITDTAGGALIDLGGGQTLLVAGITGAALADDILI